MANKTVNIFVLLTIHISISVTAQEEELSRSFTFTGVENTSSSLDSVDRLIATHKTRSAVGCAHKCLTEEDCQVIGFNAKLGFCWLMKSASRNGVLKSEETLILKKVSVVVFMLLYVVILLMHVVVMYE
jgi:hypothetical protein